MKKLIAALLVSSAVLAGCGLMAPDLSTKEGNLEFAKNWVETTSTTYMFDGSDLVHNGRIYNLSCDNCWKFEFNFNSAHPGYGNRAQEEILANVITPHVMKVTVENGEVTGAVTDGEYDELMNVSLEEPSE